MGTADILRRQGDYPSPSEENSSQRGFFDRLSALARALPQERQRVPVANALDYLNFQQLYGRPPRQGEMETEEISPASYLAGQVSGTNVARGAPGPRFGAITTDSAVLARLLREARKLLPQRILDAIESSPRTAHVTWDPKVRNAYYDLDTSNIGIPSFDRLGDWASRKGALAHELTHFGQDLQGRVTQGPVGAKFTNQAYRDFPRLGQLSEARQAGEVLPSLMAPYSEHYVDIHDSQAFLRSLEEFWPTPPRPVASQVKRSLMRKTLSHED